MRPSKGLAYAVSGVSVALFGLSISLIGLAIAQRGSTNIGPETFIGSAIAAIGVTVSLIAARLTRE